MDEAEVFLLEAFFVPLIGHSDVDAVSRLDVASEDHYVLSMAGFVDEEVASRCNGPPVDQNPGSNNSDASVEFRVDLGDSYRIIRKTYMDRAMLGDIQCKLPPYATSSPPTTILLFLPKMASVWVGCRDHAAALGERGFSSFTPGRSRMVSRPHFEGWL